MKFSTVVIDLDGTLLNSDKQVSERNYNAILACHGQGMNIVFATARPPRTVKSFLREELLRIGSFVYYNGAYIDCKHTGIEHHEPIDSALTSEVLDYCLSSHADLDISLEVKDEWLSLKAYDYSTLTRIKGGPSVKTLEELKSIDATKILFTGKMDMEALKERFAARLNIVVTDNGELVQISAINASKENAVAMLCQRLNVPLGEVIVFGDDYNDVGLFERCGWPVAMGNAVEHLKKLSQEVTDTNDADGVAKALERLLPTEFMR
ncbi:Cof-type HAD-IIB family hydrolase [Paenibacillus sp. NEAU-GSW1]|uniref:Cof-type HAD-IIB family hydrolase n=1 Tax=Paenibacillus sp. NEAU-GSW1 TaxID=2682486 RepID=UPI0012E0F47D|nr:Cof-type HAD-IIB family hydrolase [Paenibacillus sp. NEAU-GSW1]MUT65186.1 Cof-type HAD-IIB family hydrolase [Paenibacillus sp. NEAU-GSW1]